MKILTTLFLLPLTALASPAPGTVNVGGSCTISRASGSQTIELWSSFVSRKYALGYKGADGADYEIQIVNNGSGRFAGENGAVVVGFARANPEALHPSDHFSVINNETGNVNYETLTGDSGPDQFAVTRVSVPVEQVPEFQEATLQTPRAALGGVLASCSLSLSRN